MNNVFSQRNVVKDYQARFLLRVTFSIPFFMLLFQSFLYGEPKSTGNCTKPKHYQHNAKCAENRAELGNPLLFHFGENASDDSDMNPGVTSVAAAYKRPIHSQVNPRTGELQLTLAPPSLSGFFGSSITPSIIYRQAQVKSGASILGLPWGCHFPFSFIYKNRLYINGEQSYQVDSKWDSGLKYYKLKNIVYTVPSSNPPLPFDSSRKYYAKLVRKLSVFFYCQNN